MQSLQPRQPMSSVAAVCRQAQPNAARGKRKRNDGTESCSRKEMEIGIWANGKGNDGCCRAPGAAATDGGKRWRWRERWSKGVQKANRKHRLLLFTVRKVFNSICKARISVFSFPFSVLIPIPKNRCNSKRSTAAAATQTYTDARTHTSASLLLLCVCVCVNLERNVNKQTPKRPKTRQASKIGKASP